MDMNDVMDIVHQGLLHLEFDFPATRDLLIVSWLLAISLKIVEYNKIQVVLSSHNLDSLTPIMPRYATPVLYGPDYNHL